VSISTEARARAWDDLHESERFRPRYPDDLLVRWTLRHFPERGARRRALDIGCGAGRNTLFLAAEGFDTTAVDISAEGVLATRERAEAAGLEIETAVAPVHRMGLPDGHFQAAVSYGVLCYASVDEIAEALRGIAGCLEPGGRFFCMTRSDADWRRRHGEPTGPCRRLLSGLDGTPAAAEEGMEMTLLDEASMRDLFAPFEEVQLDRRTVSWWGGAFVDDDWLVSARVRG